MRIGQDDFLFYQAPGHNYDGLITFNQSKGILIVGDYLSNIEFPYVYHSFQAYRATLATLGRLIDSGKVTLLVTGHGDATEDITEMHTRLRESYAYLDQLEVAVASDKAFDETVLFQRYDFPGIMKEFHDKNVAVMRKQL